MRVYVDRQYRDQARHALNAYQSVSTGLWRIPRPGDDPRVPIPPDDALREFQVHDMSEWDPEIRAVDGDVRVLFGVRTRIRLQGGCEAVLPADGWVRVPNLEVERAEDPGDPTRAEDPSSSDPPTGTVRETFRLLDDVPSYQDRACAGPAGTVRLYGWDAATSTGR